MERCIKFNDSIDISQAATAQFYQFITHFAILMARKGLKAF
jgi:hypothetical protein